MEYGYRFRLYPNITQALQIHKTSGRSQFGWNYYLAKRKKCYEQYGKYMNDYVCSGDLTQLKKSSS